MAPPQWKVKPWRSRKYLTWVADLNCCVCGMPADDPHHEQREGHGGMGTTPGDERALPMCRRCHDIRQHGPLQRKIWKVWGRDPEQLIISVQQRWFQKFMTRPWEGGDDKVRQNSAREKDGPMRMQR